MRTRLPTPFSSPASSSTTLWTYFHQLGMRLKSRSAFQTFSIGASMRQIVTNEYSAIVPSFLVVAFYLVTRRLFPDVQLFLLEEHTEICAHLDQSAGGESALTARVRMQ